MMMPSLALYIHIPFCHRKCSYCSFISYAFRLNDIPPYLRALKAEIAQRAGNERLSSIYFGGGTPSLLTADQFAGILAAMSHSFTVDKAAEITVEANPGTVDEVYLSAIRELGINRLSLGVQSLSDRDLRLLGRMHTAADAREAVRFARSSGFDNVNMDLIYGLPGQSLPDWRDTLDEALVLTPQHLSLYSLTIEEGTPMWKAMQNGSLPYAEPDLAAEQYELTESMLADCGYRHYEISNWAKEGSECRHNMTYWINKPYVGMGVSAHSWMGNHRLANTDNLDEYLASFVRNLPLLPAMDESISPDLELAETVILGLRLDTGVEIDDINNRFNIDLMAHYGQTIEELMEAGLLESAGGRLTLTARGRLLGNEVFWRFLPDNAGIDVTC
jgi:oxygen-independent coproporphyrinogen III oxidase